MRAPKKTRGCVLLTSPSPSLPSCGGDSSLIPRRQSNGYANVAIDTCCGGDSLVLRGVRPGRGKGVAVAGEVRALELQAPDGGPQSVLRPGAGLSVGVGRRRREAPDHRPERDQDSRRGRYPHRRGEGMEGRKIVRDREKLLRNVRANEGRLLFRRGRKLLRERQGGEDRGLVARGR